MPLAGACDTLGSIGFKQTNGGYWGSGEDVEGHGSVMMLGTDDFYVFVHYNLTGSLASVRCVRNEGGAHYVSHTPTEPQTYEGFELDGHLPERARRVRGDGRLRGGAVR